MVQIIIITTVVLWFVYALREMLLLLYWIQVKEYRFDRFKVLLSNQNGLVSLGLGSWLFGLLLMIVSLLSQIPILTPGFLGLAVFVFIEVIQRKIRRPKVTSRVALIILFSISSSLFVIFKSHLLPYATAKYAQVGFSEGLRAELAAEGIVVTTIVPGFMRTGSFIAADYHDPSGAEYGWFAAGASLPLVAIDAEWAASRIVRAVRYGEGDVTLGWFARVGGTLKHAMPGLAADVLGLVNRWILPDAPPLDRPAAPHQPGTTAHHDAPQAVRAMTESTLERATSELNQPSP